MNFRNRKFLVVAGLAVTVAIAATAYALTRDYDTWTESGLYFKAEKLTATPKQYWNLTDPDPYVLAAINNLSTWILVNETTETFLTQVDQHNRIYTVCYNGAFYAIEVVYVDFWRRGPT